jgi:hypothetical protein
VDRQRIIERERRWATPAAAAAVIALIIFIASLIVQQAANVSTSASEAAHLRSIDDHAGTVLLSSVILAVAFLLVPLPMLYLFRAAQARNPRVQPAMIGFVFIGPLLFAAQGIVQAQGLRGAASDFVGAPPEQTRSYPAFQRQVKQAASSIEKVTIYTATNSLEVEQSDGTFYAVKRYPASTESRLPSQLDGASPSIDNDTDGDTEARPGDALATHTTDNDGTLQVSQALAVPALLGFVVMMVYVPLQSMRAGLLTRMVGSLGIALGAATLILPYAMLGVLLWVGYLGLLFVGRVPGGRPPAWEAGEAIPWPRPGEEQASPEGPGDAVEGEATEVPGPDGGGEPAKQPQRQKRKRRR